jgi:shikimate kinase
MTTPRHVVLTGLMGSGKTSIGVPLARRLHRRYLDNDEELQRRTGRTARELATERGIEALHREEAAAFVHALGSEESAVVGAPASVITRADIRELLRDHFVVWLDTDLDSLVATVDDLEHRPLVRDARALLERQWAERASLYRDVASLVIRSDRDDPEDDARAVETIVRHLH